MNENEYFFYPNQEINDDYYTFFDLALKYKRNRQYDVTSEIYNKIIKVWGKTGSIDVAIAKNLASSGKYEESIVFFRNAINSYLRTEKAIKDKIIDSSYNKNWKGLKLNYNNYAEILESHIKKLEEIIENKVNSKEKYRYLASIAGGEDYQILEKDYKKAVVVFIDLLGTKESTTQQNDFNESFHKIKKFHEKIKVIKNPSIGFFSRKTFILSDCCFIIFKQITDEAIDSEIAKILMSISDTCIELLEEKIVFRGGISYGNIWYDNESMFGEAANESYMLESKEAKYIRILINEELRIKLSVDYKNLFFTDPDDKIAYLNIFYKNVSLKNIEEFIKKEKKKYKNKIQNILDNEKEILSEYKSELQKYASVLQKYIWFNQYIDVIKKIGEQKMSEKNKIY